MRLFFAFALDGRLRAGAANVSDDLERRLAAAGAARAIKWVERENLHVTLRFLGEVDDSRRAALFGALDRPIGAASFRLQTGGAGCFPASGPPRVVWMGVRDGVDAARTVFEALDHRIGALGFEREPRPYTPHLTLGRVREIERAQGRQLREWLAEAPEDLGSMVVSHATLYRSQLSPKGPRYDVMKEVAL